MRNKVDSRTVGAALLATQEELKAAFNREQACEEGYNALLADLDSCRVTQETSGWPLRQSIVSVAPEKRRWALLVRCGGKAAYSMPACMA